MNDYHSNGLSSYKHPGLHEFDVFYLKVLPLWFWIKVITFSGERFKLQVFDMDLLKECAHTRRRIRPDSVAVSSHPCPQVWAHWAWAGVQPRWQDLAELGCSEGWLLKCLNMSKAEKVDLSWFESKVASELIDVGYSTGFLLGTRFHREVCCAEFPVTLWSSCIAGSAVGCGFCDILEEPALRIAWL